MIRLKRARNIDITTLDVLVDVARSWRAEGRTVLLVGMLPETQGYLERVGAIEAFGAANLFPQQPHHWFVALEDALTYAYEVVGEEHLCVGCATQEWVKHRGVS